MSVVNVTGGRIDGIDLLIVEAGGRAQLKAAARPVGYNALSKRFELRWIAGQEGKPALNAVLTWPATYTAATAIAIEIADKHFEVLGDNMTTALVTYYAEGGIVLTSAGADNDEAILLPHLDANQTPWEQVTWGTDKEVEWEAFIQMGGNIGDAVVWAGLKLTNTDVVATDADQVFFRYEAGVNGGRWEAVSSIAGTDTQTDTGVLAVAIDIRYHLKIIVDTDRVAKFYIDGVLVHTTAALTAADFKPYIGVGARGAAAAKALRVFGQAISRKVG